MTTSNSPSAAERSAVEQTGVHALMRLWTQANKDVGQSRVIARFLLSCYNGARFPFDMTDFRMINDALFEDCMAVLRMDKKPIQEVHRYLASGGSKFEQLAKDWHLVDHSKALQELKRFREQNGSGQ